MTHKVFQLISDCMLENKFSEFLEYAKRKNIAMDFNSLLGLDMAVFGKEIMEFREF